jgi:hypothetical protein
VVFNPRRLSLRPAGKAGGRKVLHVFKLQTNDKDPEEKSIPPGEETEDTVENPRVYAQPE